MHQRDVLMREIEKITELLVHLISKVSGLNSTNFEVEMKQMDVALYSQFDFTLETLMDLDKQELIEKIKDVDKGHIELLTELLSSIVLKISELKKDKIYKTDQLADNAIVLIDFLDRETKTFSLDRMNLKAKLQKSKKLNSQ